MFFTSLVKLIVVELGLVATRRYIVTGSGSADDLNIIAEILVFVYEGNANLFIRLPLCPIVRDFKRFVVIIRTEVPGVLVAILNCVKSFHDDYSLLSSFHFFQIPSFLGSPSR